MLGAEPCEVMQTCCLAGSVHLVGGLPSAATCLCCLWRQHCCGVARVGRPRCRRLDQFDQGATNCRRVASACSLFGAKAVDPKPIMKALPSLFGHTQAGVRDKVKETSVELAAYLGQVCRGMRGRSLAQAY